MKDFAISNAKWRAEYQQTNRLILKTSRDLAEQRIELSKLLQLAAKQEGHDEAVDAQIRTHRMHRIPQREMASLRWLGRGGIPGNPEDGLLDRENALQLNWRALHNGAILGGATTATGFYTYMRRETKRRIEQARAMGAEAEKAIWFGTQYFQRETLLGWVKDFDYRQTEDYRLRTDLKIRAVIDIDSADAARLALLDSLLVS